MPWFFNDSPSDTLETIHSEGGFDVIVLREPTSGDYVEFVCIFFHKESRETYMLPGGNPFSFRVYGKAANGLTRVNEEGREYFLGIFKQFLKEHPSQTQAKQSKDNP